jgi:N6-L-threonylcarbamoyladenine synthase
VVYIHRGHEARLALSAISSLGSRPAVVTGQAQAIILGIETSCDETAASIVVRDQSGHGSIRSNVVRSQLDEHAAFGGVVPELAARAHVEWLDHIIAQAMDEAGMSLDDVDAIAATAGPGLIGGVLVGLTTAKALAASLGKPLVAVNHLEGHALTARLTNGVKFPYLMLLVSGGHSQFVLVRGVGDYDRWGGTIDDALGEAFDKVAKLLSLGHPGGPAVEKIAREGDPKRFKFPRPLLREERLDFSFSGLKTAVRLQAEALAPLTDKDVADIAASFQDTVAEIVGVRARQALEKFASDFPGEPIRLVVAGGVAANRRIAEALAKPCADLGAELIVPPIALCTDTGAMIAWAGAERLALGENDSLATAARPRWPLQDDDMRIKNHVA